MKPFNVVLAGVGGQGILVAAKLLGHAGSGATERYTHVRVEQTMTGEAVAKPGFQSPLPPIAREA